MQDLPSCSPYRRGSEFGLLNPFQRVFDPENMHSHCRLPMRRESKAITLDNEQDDRKANFRQEKIDGQIIHLITSKGNGQL